MAEVFELRLDVRQVKRLEGLAKRNEYFTADELVRLAVVLGLRQIEQVYARHDRKLADGRKGN